MEWLKRSIGAGMDGRGMLPLVPGARKLEHSLFPVRRHPRHAELEQEFRLWARSFLMSMAGSQRTVMGGGPPAAARHDDVEHVLQRLGEKEIASLPSYLWPNATDHPSGRSLTLVKLMYWFTLVDELVDESAAGQRGDAVEIARLCNRLITRTGLNTHDLPDFVDADPQHWPQTTKESDALAVAVGREWWGEVQRGCISMQQQARFADEVKRYLTAQVDITCFRANLLKSLAVGGGEDGATASCTVEQYIPIRRDASAFPLGIAMVEFDLGNRCNIDEHVGEVGPLMQQLAEAASDHAAWLNDIISFPKEFASGDFVSTLLPLLHMRNNAASRMPQVEAGAGAVPFEVAVEQAWEMVAAREHDCAHLARKIVEHHTPRTATTRLAARPPSGLKQYVEALGSYTAGNWAWSLQCPRYNVLPTLSRPLVTSTNRSPLCLARSPPLMIL